ncbi:MAG: hypothetical protein J2P58_09575 [Acidimicrobiaceae bacterium]|nr:hypothetical protein [Acidimicrobiaceae bacterium]
MTSYLPAQLSDNELPPPDQRGPGSLAGKRVRQPAPPAPGELAQTMAEIEGPYFRVGAPQRSDLLEPGDEPELVISGRVLNPAGKPIPNAVVNLWHCDREGNYDMVGYKYHGIVVTDPDGRWQFTTIIPACYWPRQANHLHFKVQGVSRPLTTQLYLEGEPGAENDPYYAQSQVVRTTLDENGVKHGTYDFVIAQVTEDDNVTKETLAARV